MSKKETKNLHHIFWLLYLVSGFSGLVYEVVWVRLFGFKFGVSSLAVGSVLAAFMLGLALGSYFWGRVADNYSSPLKLYAVLELGIGLYALGFPFLLNIADKLYLSFFMGFQGDFSLIALGRFVLALILIFIPTALMGGTLPVLARFFARRPEVMGREIGYLYGINIMGAVLGCFSAGFILIGHLGVSQTNYLAVVLNVVIAVIAFSTGHKFTLDEEKVREQRSVPEIQNQYLAGNTHTWLYLISLVALGAGFTSLSYEILWHRILALMLRNTVYAFSTMLTTFLVGLFLGSFLVGRFMDARPRILPQILGLLELGIGLYALAVIPLFGKLNELFYVLEIEKGFFGQSWALFAGGQFLLCAAVMLLPSIMMGAIFPLICKLYFMLPDKATGQETGRGVGRVYAINTLGAVLGSFASSFLLIPLLGTKGCVILAAAINLGLGVWVLKSAPKEIKRKEVCVVGLLIFLVLAVWGVSRDITFRGMIKAAGEEILFKREDNSSLIEVTRNMDNGARMLISNRQQQEGDSSWLSVHNQRKQVYLPLFLHPNPRRVLGIGMGTGISWAALTNYPLELAKCVELSPGVMEAASFFATENNDITNNPNIKIIEADGRNYLRLTENKYDVIIADLFSSFRAGVGNLYSREHYLQCKEKLAPGGIICQWLPPHQLPGDSLKIIAKTFQDVFPHSSLWLTRQAMALIASDKPLKIDYQKFKAHFMYEKVSQDLKAFSLYNHLGFLNSFVMGEAKLYEFVKGMAVNTDDKPLIEFMTPKEFYRLTNRSLFDQHVSETMQYREPVYYYLKNIDESDLLDKLDLNYTARWHANKGEDLAEYGDYMSALEELRQALIIDNNQAGARQAMGKYYLSQGDELFKNGLLNEAARAYWKALEAVPLLALAHYGLAKVYYKQGAISAAQQELSQAMAIDPYDQRIQIFFKQIQ